MKGEPVSDPEYMSSVHAEIAEMARVLHSSDRVASSIDDILLDVTETAVRVLPGVDDAGVMLVKNSRQVRSTGATGEMPETLDKLQQVHQQGPCLDAAWQHHTVRVDDFQSEDRWPDFVSAALDSAPVRSSLSIQLYTDDAELGALNLYSQQPNTFTPDIEEMAVVLAAHAAIALSGARRSERFRSALASRDIIGQAKGIIMERYKVTAVDAFQLLIRLSQNSNIPLTELARRLVQTENPQTEKPE